MIEIKANTKNGSDHKGVDISLSMEGRGDDIGAEILSIISALMRNIRQEDILLHAQCIKIIAENPEILLGEDIDEEVMEDRVAMSLGKMTDKCVIN